MFQNYEIVQLDEADRMLQSSTSKGNQTKWFRNNRYYKADSFGYEGLAEWVVSGLSECIQNFDYTPYKCCLIEEAGHSYNGCYSKSFLKPEESFISFSHILELKYLDYSKQMQNGFQSSFQFVCDEINKVTELDVSSYIAQNLYLDAIILNEDRHLNNLGIIKGDGYYRLAPVFDNGLSLLSDLKWYDIYEPIEKNMHLVKAKPFSSRFDKQIKELNKMGLIPLKIDRDKAMKMLDSLESALYPEEYIVRCRTIIKKNLRKWEGFAWIEA